MKVEELELEKAETIQNLNKINKDGKIGFTEKYNRLLHDINSYFAKTEKWLSFNDMEEIKESLKRYSSKIRDNIILNKHINTYISLSGKDFKEIVNEEEFEDIRKKYHVSTEDHSFFQLNSITEGIVLDVLVKTFNEAKDVDDFRQKLTETLENQEALTIEFTSQVNVINGKLKKVRKAEREASLSKAKDTFKGVVEEEIRRIADQTKWVYNEEIVEEFVEKAWNLYTHPGNQEIEEKFVDFIRHLDLGNMDAKKALVELSAAVILPVGVGVAFTLLMIIFPPAGVISGIIMVIGALKAVVASILFGTRNLVESASEKIHCNPFDSNFGDPLNGKDELPQKLANAILPHLNVFSSVRQIIKEQREGVGAVIKRSFKTAATPILDEDENDDTSLSNSL